MTPWKLLKDMYLRDTSSKVTHPSTQPQLATD
uniref:Uncharacterized protein n=1 Tax=Anguilla anguilla TaxID=7936 RepID=A0A0E9XWN1_ANGAN